MRVSQSPSGTASGSSWSSGKLTAGGGDCPGTGGGAGRRPSWPAGREPEPLPVAGWGVEDADVGVNGVLGLGAPDMLGALA
jgi:hypothetical protein